MSASRIFGDAAMKPPPPGLTQSQTQTMSSLGPGSPDSLAGGRKVVLQKRNDDQVNLENFEADLRILRGTCTLCRARRRDFNHTFQDCSQKGAYLSDKFLRLQKMKEDGKPWFPPYHACYKCYLPQNICRKPAWKGGSSSSGLGNARNSEGTCSYQDVLLPWIYGMWETQSQELLYEYSTEYSGTLDTAADLFEWVAAPMPWGGERKAHRGVHFMATFLHAHSLLRPTVSEEEAHEY